MKKLCSWIATIVLTISMLPGITPSTHAASFGDLSYTITNGEVTITDCNETASGTLEIPAEIEGCPVTRIESLAFNWCTLLDSVTFPASLRYIGINAFSSCYLDEIHISNLSAWCNITFDGYCANPLYGGHDLYLNDELIKNLEIPSDVTIISEYAFNGASFESVYIPETVTDICSFAFSECAMNSLILSESITTIREGTFYNVQNLTDVYYAGTEEQAAAIIFETTKWPLDEAVWHYNCTCIKNDNNENHTYKYSCSTLCAVCKKERTVSTDSHSFDAICDAECNICGWTRTIQHSFSTPCQTFCDFCHTYQPNPAEHTYQFPCSSQCSVCNAYRDTSLSREDHSFSSDCDESCNLCGTHYSAPGVHSYDYVCSIACNKCGQERGAWQAQHHYANDCDPDCEYCGETREVEGHAYYSNCDAICYRCHAERQAPHNLKSACATFCFDCWQTVPAATAHSFDSPCDPYCNFCGESSSTFHHTYDNEEDQQCNICNCTRESLFTFELYAHGGYNNVGFDWAAVKSITNDSITDLHVPSHINVDGIVYPVESIDSFAFSDNTAITHVVLPETITSISQMAFARCSSLQRINLPESITEIDSGVFSGCSNLQSITLPESITEIGSGVFSGCSSLKGISLPESITEIYSSVFSGCSSLEYVGLPANLSFIGSSAFNGCQSLKSISLPNTVTTIEDYAFAGCSGLTNLNIPANVSSIGNDAEDSVGIMVFSECSNLTELTVDPENHWFSAADRILYNKEKTEIVLTLDTVSGNVTLPETLDSIKEYTFRDRLGLTGITIPNSVQTIGEYAFSGCENLNLVDLGEGVELIEEFAFSSTGISTIEIPNSVTTLGLSSFGSNYYLKSVSIPSRVSVMDSPFSSCYFLESIEVAEDNPYFTAHNGAVYDKDQTVLLFCAQGYAKEIIIPDTVKDIKTSFDFCLCSAIILPEKFTKLDNSFIFYACPNLEFIYLPKTISYMTEDVFFWCRDITIYYGGTKEERNNTTGLSYFPGWEAKIDRHNWRYNCTSFGGDIDQDQIITTADVSALMRRLNTSSDYIGNADINNDGKNSLADALALLKTLAA